MFVVAVVQNHVTLDGTRMRAHVVIRELERVFVVTNLSEGGDQRMMKKIEELERVFVNGMID